jgi:glycosyltransferase involved in cell wall biosynthesis
MNYLLGNGYNNVKLFLVGNASIEYLNEITEIIKINKLEKYIEYLGYRKKLNNLRKVANIEINCSRSEGFGRTTLEAMLSMNPIIGA